MLRHWEKGAEPENVPAQYRGHCAGEGDGNQASRLPLKQEKLHREQNRCDRRCERRRHAGGGTRHKQRFPLRAGQAK